MSHRIDDRWLWLGVGIGLIFAVKGIRYAIQDTLRLTQVQPLGEDHDEELNRRPEDSIPVDTLRTLVDSPNPNISRSATDLVLDRCSRTPSLIAEVQADAMSSDPALRRKARLSLQLLGSYALGDMSNQVPGGVRTGGSTGALDLSPSMVSLDSGFEFDGGSLPPRLGAHQVDRGGEFENFENGDTSVWTTVAARHDDDVDEVESGVERRRRHRETVVMSGGS